MMVRANWLAAWIVSGLLLAGAASAAQHKVTVQTADGRDLSGVVDARTDERALWLRQQEAGVTLTVAAPWSEVTAAQIGESAVDIADLKEQAEQWATPGPTMLLEAIELPIDGAVQPMAATRRAARLDHLEILEACLANFDRDVEPDGLRVTIAAIAEDGAPLCVRGNLSAELIGERRPAGRVEFDAIGRWSQSVERSDFVEGAASYELPFRTTAPERELDLLPDAVLTVRLGAHGEGQFAASVPVALRQFNPLRDNHQLFRGTRLLPQELTGRRPSTRHQSPDGNWLWWGR